LQTWPAAADAVVAACWFLFAVVFLLRPVFDFAREHRLRKKPPKAVETKRDSRSLLGMALQGAGFALVWSYRREYFTPLVPMAQALEAAVSIVTMAIAVAAFWLGLAALRELGRQWAVVARVVEGHKLITGGPYRCVRNPIYLAMFGMMVATGLALSTWWIVLVAALIFHLGTAARVHSEERLLRETFGAEFESYRRRVPAFFPRLL